MTRSSHRAHWPLALVAGSLLALCWTALTTSPPRLVYNASASMPIGWYRITATSTVTAGNLLLVRLPAEAMTLAAQRGYLPTTVPLLKRVAAVAPQLVCVSRDQVQVDSLLVAKQLRRDRQGRALPVWRGCRRLVDGELFLLGSHPESFDSRYFGPVSANAVIGRAQPLWLESRR